MTPWVVRYGVIRQDGTVEHQPLDDLTLSFIRSFPHRVDVARGDHWIAGGGFDDRGHWFPCTPVDTSFAGRAVLIVVDLLGIEAPADL